MSVTYLIHLGFLYTLSPRADHSDPHKRDNWSNFSQLIMVSTANICCTPRTVLVLWESLRKPRTSFCSQRAFCYTQGVYIPGNSSQRSQGVKSRGNSARKKTQLSACSASWDYSQHAVWKSPLPTFRMSRINHRNNLYQVPLGSAPNSLTPT